MAMIGVLICWMAICAWCGFTRRFGVFLLVLLVGLGLNMGWMVIGLAADPFEPHLIMALMAMALYGLVALGCGWLAGRLAQHWRASRVDPYD